MTGRVPLFIAFDIPPVVCSSLVDYSPLWLSVATLCVATASLALSALALTRSVPARVLRQVREFGQELAEVVVESSRWQAAAEAVREEVGGLCERTERKRASAAAAAARSHPLGAPAAAAFSDVRAYQRHLDRGGSRDAASEQSFGWNGG